MEENTVLEEKKEPKTTKQKVFFGLRIAGNIIFYAILVILFLFAIMNINGGPRNQGFPNIFGRGYLNVASDSMSHENLVNDIYKKYPEYKDYEIQGLEVGDLITSKVLDDEDRQNLKVGDVCTFYDSNLNALNTHRIIVIEKDSNGKISEIIFQGDKSVASYGKYDTLSNEEKVNLFGRNEIQVFGSDLSNIKGLTVGVTAGGGKVLQNLQDNYLFYFVLPVGILLLVEVFFVIRNIMILRGEKNKAELEGTREAMMADVEAEKEKMRQELLAEMRAQGLVIEDTVKEEPKEETKVEKSTEDNKEEIVETTEVVEETKTDETTEEVAEEASNDVEEKKEETEEETTSEE